MAPRANWKGYLRLSLVSCPVALYPATTEREKVHFHRINRRTGHRLRMQNVDEKSGDVVDKDDIGRGYEIGKGKYVEVTEEELQAIALDSTRMIDIQEFVPAKEIDQIYNIRPYYVVPDGEVGQQAFAVIREAIDKEGMVALGRVVLTNREHVIALEPRDKGLVGTLLRYPYEVRDAKQYFDDIPNERIPKDMLDLATHIVRTKVGHFDPEHFHDRYEEALRALLKKKQAGEEITPPPRRESAKVINLMDALRRSLDVEKRPAARATARRARTHRHRPAKRTGTRRKAS